MDRQRRRLVSRLARPLAGGAVAVLLAGCDQPPPAPRPSPPATAVIAGPPSPAASPSPSPSPNASPTATRSPTATPSPTPTATPTPLPSPEASPAVAAPSGWAAVTDPNGRWRVDVPLSWRREIRFSQGTFTAPFFDAVAVVRIIPLNEVGGTRDLRAAATSYVEGQGPPIDRPQLEGIDTIDNSVAGTPRVQARYTYERRGQRWNATAILDLRGNAIYVIDVATTRDKAGDYADTLQHMIGSLRFIY